jgi:hypothetical protein
VEVLEVTVGDGVALAVVHAADLGNGVQNVEDGSADLGESGHRTARGAGMERGRRGATVWFLDHGAGSGSPIEWMKYKRN